MDRNSGGGHGYSRGRDGDRGSDRSDRNSGRDQYRGRGNPDRYGGESSQSRHHDYRRGGEGRGRDYYGGAGSSRDHYGGGSSGRDNYGGSGRGRGGDSRSFGSQNKRGRDDEEENVPKRQKVDNRPVGMRGDPFEVVNTRNDLPKRGSRGNEISLITNYYRVKKVPQTSLVQYRVDFEPECDDDAKKKYLIYTQRPLFGAYLFDRKNTVYLAQKLASDEITVNTQDREGTPYQLKIKFTNIVMMGTRCGLQVLNVILRRTMEGLELQLVGRNLFDPQARIDIPEYQLQLWPGYVTTIRQHEEDIMLCAEITHKVMRCETVYNILEQHRGNREYFKEDVCRTVVLTDYNNKTYRITDVNFNQTPESTFTLRNGESITFAEYFKRKYNIQIRNLTQPLLVATSTERQRRGGADNIISLIPELCRPTGITDSQKSNFSLMKRVSNHTRMTPDVRIQRLQTFNRRILSTANCVDAMRQWNFNLDSELVRVTGRTLPPEKLNYGDGEKSQVSDRAEWQQAFRDKSMFHSIALTRWYVIVPRSMSSNADSFLQSLYRVAHGMRFDVGRAEIRYLNDDRNKPYLDAIDEVMRCDPQFILIFFPTNNAEKYSNVKKLCCVQWGIPTQVVLRNTIVKAKSLMSVATKVAVQINSKLGGLPWMIGLPTKGLMTVGIDVSKDSVDKDKAWFALVATMDLKQSGSESFYSNVTQQKFSEMGIQTAISLRKAILCYQQVHNSLPEKILVYRDGVGDGNIANLQEYEVNPMVEMLKTLYGLEDPKLVFVVVSKKINTRIMLPRGNPPPGTVVDDVITLPERNDFYLISQNCGQGTVSPTSYNTIWNKTTLTADHIQYLTYKQTHLYFNWFGTLRVPAVCQYAHKLSFLVANYLHDTPSVNLDKNLYFL